MRTSTALRIGLTLLWIVGTLGLIFVAARAVQPFRGIAGAVALIWLVGLLGSAVVIALAVAGPKVRARIAQRVFR